MTKQVDSKNQIWFEQQENVVKIGFTKSFLEGMDQCWHILPANLTKFRSKSPLLTVETNDSLISIMSPVSGNFFAYSDKASNFPDKLTEEDVVLEIGMGAAIRPEPPMAPEPPRAMQWDEHQNAVVQRMQRQHEALVNARVTVGGGVPDRLDFEVPATAGPRPRRNF